MALTSSCNPPNDTVDPTLLSNPMVDWDDIAPNDDWQRDNGSIRPRKVSGLESESSPLFMSVVDNILAELEGSGQETPQAEYPESSSIYRGSISSRTPQLCNNTDLVMGLPTPRSDSPSPTIHLARKTNHPRCWKFNVCKPRTTRQNTHRQASLRKGSQTNDPSVGREKVQDPRAILSLG